MSINAIGDTKFDMAEGLGMIVTGDAYNPIRTTVNIPARVGVLDPLIYSCDTTTFQWQRCDPIHSN
jgi:hypothetical protein